MRLRTLLSVSFCFFLFIVQAQSGKLTGKVTNEKNEPLPGVTIQIKGGNGARSASDGTYQLSLNRGSRYELTFSIIGYETKVISDVEFTAASTELNVTMKSQPKEEAGVVITTRTTQRRESVNSLLQFQKNTNTVASVISAESIRRSPDRNTGEVLKRTPGASIQEGRFIVVRGLADRYNQAMLNGILLSSTEPDRKTFSFDLIPAPMIDNIVINKAFVPEYPGEWAGGLIQVNTKDIPTKGFFNLQVGTGFNSQTIGRDFLKDKGGKWDWLGIDDGTRGLPSGYTTKSEFDTSSSGRKTALGRTMRNAWAPEVANAPMNVSFQANGGFSTKLFGKTIGGTAGVIYTKNNRNLDLLNQQNSLSNGVFSQNTSFNDRRYAQDVSLGALGSVSMVLNQRNRISLKSIINVNSSNSVTSRNGLDRNRTDSIVTGSEFSFRQNTFFTTQLAGQHTVATDLKLNWYGSFNILDGYVPDQRRILYTKVNPADPYRVLVSNTLSQQSGSRIFQNLSDYIYTAGGDLAYGFDAFGQKQTVKGGYMFQVKDRLYDAKLFAIYYAGQDQRIKELPADQIFAPQHFGSAAENKFGFDAIKGNTFRYMANTILNAGFLQFDNQLSDRFRLVWGLRVEDYDQLVGSVKTWDPRHTHTRVTDYLPGLNATYKINSRSNLRISGSQTVIRPELRELSALNLYDFELNASVQGKPDLKRTKVTNADLRYELYPRAGDVLTLGAFYKRFKDPIEQVFNEGSGGASTFTFQNPEKAYSYGAELDFRKKLDFATGLKNFTFQGNFAYIKSRIRDSALNIDRPLQGQSPYLVNLGLLYDWQQRGVTATVLFNQIGKRIYLVGDISSGAGSPDIYEASRPLLDFQITKKLFNDRSELRLNVSDILNRTQYFYQNANPVKETDLDKGADAYRFTRRFGTTFSLTFNYSIL